VQVKTSACELAKTTLALLSAPFARIAIQIISATNAVVCLDILLFFILPTVLPSSIATRGLSFLL
jgi:hypothetical protein